MRLDGRTAIVTGGARGIGAGIARGLLGAGARVAILDVDGDEAARTAREMGANAVGLGADVSEEADAARAVAEAVARLGALDVLVNNAGGGGPHAMESAGNPFTNITQAGWDDALAVNLRTAFATTKAAIPHLERRGAGAIVNIASIAALIPEVSIPAYAAAKAGVVSLTRSLALELAAKRIRVNAICPGYVWTRAWELLATGLKMTVPAYASLEPRDVFLDVVKRNTPLGREQTAEDMANLAVFLCSDAAANITGQAIAVDGGITLGSISP